MRKFLILISVIITSISFALTNDAISFLKQSDSYISNELTFEKSMIEYNNAKITADSTISKLNVQVMYYSALSNYQNGKLNFYKGAISTLFSVNINKLNLEIKRLTLENAQKSYESSKEQYEKNLISNIDLIKSEYDMKNAQYNLKVAQSDLDNSLREFKKYFNFEENYTVDINYISLEATNIDTVPDYMVQKLNYLILSNEFDAVKDYLSEADKRKKEIDLKLSKINLDNLKENIEDTISSLREDLDFLKLELEVLELNKKYQEENLKDFKNRYEKGLIEKEQYNQAYILYLSTLMQIETKKMNYVNKLLELAKYSGENFEDILKDAVIVKRGE